MSCLHLTSSAIAAAAARFCERPHRHHTRNTSRSRLGHELRRSERSEVDFPPQMVRRERELNGSVCQLEKRFSSLLSLSVSLSSRFHHNSLVGISNN